MLGRITIDTVRPTTPTGEFPAKAVVGERVPVSADIFRDGHDLLAARVRWRRVGKSKWRSAPLRPVVNDRWEGELEPTDVGRHELVIEAWRDRFATWRHDIEIKAAAGDDVELELEEGARILEALVPPLGARAASACSTRWPGSGERRAHCRCGSTPASTTGWPRWCPASPTPT